VAGIETDRLARAVVPPVLFDQFEQALHPAWPIFGVPVHFSFPPSAFVTGVPDLSGVPEIWQESQTKTQAVTAYTPGAYGTNLPAFNE
jgi:hypothetical protein